MVRALEERFTYAQTDFRLTFDRARGDGPCYSFDCTPSGGPVFDPEHEGRQRRSYEDALAGVETGEFRSPYVARYLHSWTSPEAIECDCGGRVDLASSWANTCGGCGADYDGSGRQLAPRHQWGEETGERFACRCGRCPDGPS